MKNNKIEKITTIVTIIYQIIFFLAILNIAGKESANEIYVLLIIVNLLILRIQIKYYQLIKQGVHVNIDKNKENKHHEHVQEIDKNSTLQNNQDAEQNRAEGIRNKAEQKGKEGENKIINELKNFNAYNKIIRNLYIPTKNGKSTEIDILILSTKGIYVIENKNYSGWIFGDEEQVKWCQSFKDKKFFFYNPILQNKTHIDNLNEILKLPIETYESIIIFDRAEIKKLNVLSEKTYVVGLEKFQFYIRNQDKLKDILTNEEVEQIYNKLQKYMQTTEETKIRHIMNTQNI